jgi:hypothetical protein
VPCHCIAASQLEELLTQVIPGSSSVRSCSFDLIANAKCCCCAYHCIAAPQLRAATLNSILAPAAVAAAAVPCHCIAAPQLEELLTQVTTAAAATAACGAAPAELLLTPKAAAAAAAVPRHCIAAPQLEELLTQVIPGSSLSELTALECIIASLLQQGKLAANTASVMYGLMVRNICEYFTQLEQLPADALQQQIQAEDQQPAAEGADHMDTDDEAAADTAAGQGSAAAAEAAKVAMLRSVLRHCFTLLSMLTAAQPSLLDPQFVPALLEVGFSPKLAVSCCNQHICYADTWHVAATSCSAGTPLQQCMPYVPCAQHRGHVCDASCPHPIAVLGMLTVSVTVWLC